MTGAGSLTLLDGGLLGNTSGSISGGALAGSPSGELIVTTPADFTIGSTIVDNGGATGLTKVGPATLVLIASNTYSGATTVGAGTLQVGNGGATGALGTGPVIVQSALVFDLSGAPTFGGAVSGGGSLIQANTGVLTLTGSNSYTGGTAINFGTLKLGAAAALPSGSAVTVDGTLDLGALDAAIGALTGTGTVNHSGAGRNTLTVGSGDASSDFEGTIANSGGPLTLVKTGLGQLVLSGGDNTYTGGTMVEAGTLYVTDTDALPGGTSLTVGAGGTFIFDPAATAGPASGGSPEALPGAAVAAGPEPGPLALLAAALGSLTWATRRRPLWSAVACHRFSRRPVPRPANPHCVLKSGGDQAALGALTAPQSANHDAAA
jgi:autotransporter-associated beta strand protein